MAELPTRRDLFAVGRRSIVTTPGLRINPKVIDVQGSDLNIIVGAAALMGETISARFAANLRQLFVDTGSNEGLDRVTFDRYQINRKGANPATVKDHGNREDLKEHPQQHELMLIWQGT